MLGEPEWVPIKGVDDPCARAPADGDQAAGWPGRARRGEPGRTALGDGGARRRGGPRDRRSRWRGECGGTARHRQEPDGPGDGGIGRRSRRRGVLDLLRIPCQRRSLPCGGAAAARGHRRRRASTATPPAPGCGNGSRTPTRRICCFSMICWASPTPMCRCPKIDPDARRRRLTALINTASLARERTGAVHHRGRALDRWGQRVDAGRLPHGHPAHPVAGADHLPPRIPRGA